MSEAPTLIAVFEPKTTWQENNPVLSKSGYGRFLVDDESIVIILGIVKLFTGGGLGFWWIVDLVLLLSGQMTDGDGKFVRK